MPHIVVSAPFGVAGLHRQRLLVRSSAWIWDFVRHEALHYRMEVRGLHPRSVAAGRGS